MCARTSIIPAERIQARIHLIREQQVMLDSDLADIYGVRLGAMNQAVRRNIDRFPRDFMFQLTSEEVSNLKSQIVISSSSHGGRRHRPLVFTEHGVAMMSSILRSPRAVQMNIAIVRVFIELRRYAITHEELRKRIDALEKSTDRGLKNVMETIRKLLEPEATPPKPTLGFARKKVG